MVLGLGQLQVLIYAENHGRSHVGRTQTVTAAYDNRGILLAVEGVSYIQQQRLAIASGLLGTVQDSNALTAGGNSLQQVLYAEGAIQVNADQTVLLAIGIGMVDSLTCSLGTGAHHDDNLLSILSSVVAEELILTACTL